MPRSGPTGISSISFLALRLKVWLPILVWAVIGLVLIGLLWLIVTQQIAQAKEEAEKHIYDRTVSAANSYALQLGHMVREIDQITLRLKHQWEHPNIPVNLEEERKYGLYPAHRLLYASIFNDQGALVTTTVMYHRPANISDLPYFQLHKTECCVGFHISEPAPSRFFGRTIVRFSRRLNKPDVSFDGVVLVSVEPPYLVTFQEDATPGKNDFISVRLTDGPLIASKVGTFSGAENLPIFYRQEPIFPTVAGVTLEPAEKFFDNQTRFVAWKKLDNYPLVAIAGFSARDALLPFEEQAQQYRRAALIGSLVIAVFSAVAGYLAAAATNRRRQTEETRETYRLATDAAHEGFYMIRPLCNRQGNAEDFRLDDCNNRAAELVGLTREQLIGLKASELVPKSFAEEMLELCYLALDQGFLEEEVRVSPASPVKAHWIYRRIVRSHAGLAMTVRDISEAKQQEQVLAHMANTDRLTGLPNRHWLSSFLPNAIDHALHGTKRLAVLFIDLDNFKNINDTLGHEAGDELLLQAAQRLKNATRSSDHVARLGGDEFVVILDHVDLEEDISKVAKAIIHAISKPFLCTGGTGNQVTASIGISLLPQDGRDAETLLKHADIAMYAAKAAGKGRYAFYQTHLSDSLVLRLTKEQALRQAIDKDQFVVYFQPRVGVQSGRLTSMEALVRWERPGHGLVFPCEFIDVAEDIGLIVGIGELVLEKVCRQIMDWQAQGLELVPVSVNVSPQQLESGTLSSHIASCIARYRIDPALLEAELTESAVIDRSEVVTNELAALRALGIKLMIDDFGTGYSSMAQLHRLDVDVLKVDQAFTRALSTGSEGQYLFRAIVSMAKALDICVVAEGVETTEELRVLARLSCDEIQGHIVSKAVGGDDMMRLILKRFLLTVPHEPDYVAQA